MQTVAQQHSDDISSNQICDTRINFKKKGAGTHVQAPVLIRHIHSSSMTFRCSIKNLNFYGNISRSHYLKMFNMMVTHP